MPCCSLSPRIAILLYWSKFSHWVFIISILNYCWKQIVFLFRFFKLILLFDFVHSFSNLFDQLLLGVLVEAVLLAE
jgi:hypothetical protein